VADFTALRAAVRTAESALSQALYQANAAPGASNQTAFANAQQNLRAARAALNAALAASLPAGADVASNLRGDLPVALFPVRVETRFVRSFTAAQTAGLKQAATATFAAPGSPTVAASAAAASTAAASTASRAGTLQIRIFPDEILAQTHEPELTDEEWAAGRAYWTAGDSLASWAGLLAQFSAPRAAWIVSQTNTTTRPPARTASWTRPATAILPDNFAAFAYRGGALVASTIGSAVAEPLTLTVSPAIDAAQRVTLPGSSLQMDADLLWTVQFAAAKAVGMGLEMPLMAADWTNGFDLLLVVGAKGSFSVAEAGQQIQALFDGHHYTRGFAFIPPGTPTANQPDAPSGYPPADPGGAASFAVERGTLAAGDGITAAGALGIPAETVAHIEHTDLQSDAAMQAMLTVLWPATLGYHLEQMMAPANAALSPPWDANAVAAAYSYTRNFLRPGGPLPAFRTGAVPYALLPATSVSQLAAATPGPLATALASLWQSLLTASAKASRVDPNSADPDGDLINALRLEASSLSYQVQVLIGSDLQVRIGTLAGSTPTPEPAPAANSVLSQAGLSVSGTPRIAAASFGQTDRFSGVLVSSLPDRQSPLPDSANYIKWIASQLASGGADLAADSLPAGYERTLLYQLLRHSVLVEKGRDAKPNIREVEVLGLDTSLIHAAATPVVTTAATPAATPVVTPEVAARTAAGDAKFGLETSGRGAKQTPPPPPPPASHMADVSAALGALAGLPIADLERLFTETLDACSHRFDAWITSLATERLKELRGATGGQGAHFGAYGWVQNIRPAAAPFDPGPGGFIHAPSPNHAQTAAILRNGFLARGAPGTPFYAFDLSSARVRSGLEVLARVRDGESLSEILGTELETRLRADSTLAAKFLEPLRTSYPMPSSPIVDGLAAVLAWRANPTSPHFPSAIFSDVAQLLDSTADLLTAESVYQAVSGNPMGAAAGLDALGQGARPPEPAVAHGPVAGTAVSHRVAVVLDDSAAPGWTAAPTPRASACRYIDAWLGQLLGDPQRTKCRVTTKSGVQTISLAQLGLRPVDVLALASAPLDGSSELDLRIRAAAGDSQGVVNYAADPSLGPGAIVFPAALQLARQADLLLSRARPLLASDFTATGASVSDTSDPDAAARAQSALTALSALDLTTPSTQQAQLRQAALFGLGGAFQADGATPDQLAAAALRVEAQRLARIHQAAGTTDPAEIIRCVFGRRFPLLGQFAVPAEVTPAMAGPAGLAAADVDKWVHKAARVRPGLERWRRMRLFADALGAPPVSWNVVQLPYSSQASWCALPFSAGAGPSSGTVSIAVNRPWKTAPARKWAGLLIEEWSELIPAAVQQTGIAFHYPAPRSEAPQAVLLAVPPPNKAAWSTAVLADVVRETFELAQIRLLTPDLLSSFSQLLPATSLTVNSAGDGLSTNLWRLVIAQIQWAPVSGS
jgi:hypothetical protein